MKRIMSERPMWQRKSLVSCKDVFNKKGSVTVFLTSILVAMIMAGFAFVNAASSICGASYSDAVLDLAGRSVLAEFDRRLKDEYGIFAYYGLEDKVKADVKLYASASFNKTLPGEARWFKSGVTDLFRLRLESLEADLADYSLMDVGVFEKQVEEYMNFLMVQKGIGFIRNLWKSGENKDKTEGQSEERTLVNQAEINSLPSGGYAANGIDISAVASSLSSLSDTVFNESASAFKVNEYILSHFKYCVGGDKEKESFFKNEVEYILYGKMSDGDNKNRFKTDFFALREILNLAHIAANPKKREAIIVMSEPFGPFATAAAALIWAAWSLAETENDAKLIMEGKNVAFWKTDDTWALTLKNAVSARSEKDEKNVITGVNVRAKPRSKSVSPSSGAGQSYADYLRIFLYFEKRETKLLRTMDLIQLNLRGSYYSDFLIKEHYTGFRLTAFVSGKKFAYEQKY